jgi:hypothetical protein
LPDHLTAAKCAERAEQRQQEAEREALRRSIADRIARSGAFDADERAQLREDVARAYGHWSPEAREIEEQLDELDRQAADPADAGNPAESEEVNEEQPQTSRTPMATCGSITATRRDTRFDDVAQLSAANDGAAPCVLERARRCRPDGSALL